MTSSSKVIKAGQQTLGRQRVAVEVPLLAETAQFAPDVENALDEVVDRAKSEARAIIEEAEMQAQWVLRQAHDEGYQAGLDQGRNEGRSEARVAWDELRKVIEEPLHLVEQSRDYLNRLNDESTLALAAALTMAVFTRLKLERLDVVAQYIEELSQTLDDKKVSVFLDASWGPRLTALTEVLQDSVHTLVLAVDDALASGEMRAEGETGGVLGGPLLSLKALLQEVLG